MEKDFACKQCCLRYSLTVRKFSTSIYGCSPPVQGIIITLLEVRVSRVNGSLMDCTEGTGIAVSSGIRRLAQRHSGYYETGQSLTSGAATCTILLESCLFDGGSDDIVGNYSAGWKS